MANLFCSKERAPRQAWQGSNVGLTKIILIIDSDRENKKSECFSTENNFLSLMYWLTLKPLALKLVRIGLCGEKQEPSFKSCSRFVSINCDCPCTIKCIVIEVFPCLLLTSLKQQFWIQLSQIKKNALCSGYKKLQIYQFLLRSRDLVL